jgi:hypothetical protein
MKKSTFFICLMLVLANVGSAQTVFWSDTFEDTGAPTSGTRTPENNGGVSGIPFSSYFVRAASYQILTTVSYSQFQGNKFWAGENHSLAFGAGKEEQQIDFTGITITGKKNLSFKGLFAANNSNKAWDNSHYVQPDAKTDYVLVEYRIDGGAYQPLIKFFGNNAGDKLLSEDTNNDSLGDGPGLTPAFSEYTKNINGTGTTLDLRIRAFSNDVNEEWAIDNFRLFEVLPCNLVLAKGTVKNVSCKGGKDGAASITVTGATGTPTYNWTPGNPVGDGTASISGLTAGTYTCTVTDAACTKTIEVVVGEPALISTTQKLTICQGKSVKVGIHTYTTTGKYTDVLTSYKGCDSTVITDLTVTPAITKNQEFTVCYGKSVKVGTHTYTMSGTYTDNLKTKEGCDSIVTTKLTVLKENKKTQVLTICKGKSVKVGNHVYTTSGYYTDTLIAANKCDSIVITDLTVNPATTYSQQLYVCAGGSVKVGKHIYTKSGVYKDTVKTKEGCDSIVTSILNFSNQPYTGQQTLTTCAGKPIKVGDKIHGVSGTYVDTIKTKAGCDSVVTTKLTVTKAPEGSQKIIQCEGKPVVVGTHVHTKTGVYKDTVKTPGGCDSIVTTDLVVIPAPKGSQQITTCAGKPIKVGDHVHGETGVYEDRIKTAGGCDSIVTTYLTVTKAPEGSQSLTTCSGKPVKVGNHYYYKTGNYVDTVKLPGGCDSILKTNLTVTPPISGGSRVVTTCQGKPVKIGNIYYDKEGTYIDTVKAHDGCDSTVSVQLTVTPAQKGEQKLNICQGKTLVINNHIYDKTGIYTDTVKTAGGCDSILVTNLTVNPAPLATLDLSSVDTACLGPDVLLTGGSPAGGVYSGTGVTGNVFKTVVAGAGAHVITYTITDFKGCEGSAKASIYVEVCTDVTTEEIKNTLVVYPNPHKDNFTIELTLTKSDMVSIRMTNILGETVKQIEKSVLSGVYKNVIGTEELPQGIYFITVQTSDERIVQRVIKN